MRICQLMCDEMKVDYDDLISFSVKAPRMYKVYAIPKRTSGKRIIAHPAKKVKKYQECLVKVIQPIFSVHKRAFAYQKGTSIKKNAQQHQHSRYLLKMDFHNFFNSITSRLFTDILPQLNVTLSDEDKLLIEYLAFWCPSKESAGKRILSVGAPSSPYISNWLMSKFDQVVFELCVKQEVTYTRYADDLTFSTNHKNILFGFPKLIKEILFSQFNGAISINDSKTVFSSKGHNRHVTGITITNDGKISIGRERKRYISLLIHKFSINQLPHEDIDHLCGLLAFANHIEPDFQSKMRSKYSESLINQLLSLQGTYLYE